MHSSIPSFARFHRLLQLFVSHRNFSPQYRLYLLCYAARFCFWPFASNSFHMNAEPLVRSRSTHSLVNIKHRYNARILQIETSFPNYKHTSLRRVEWFRGHYVSIRYYLCSVLVRHIEWKDFYRGVVSIIYFDVQTKEICQPQSADGKNAATLRISRISKYLGWLNGAQLKLNVAQISSSWDATRIPKNW